MPVQKVKQQIQDGLDGWNNHLAPQCSLILCFGLLSTMLEVTRCGVIVPPVKAVLVLRLDVLDRHLDLPWLLLTPAERCMLALGLLPPLHLKEPLPFEPGKLLVTPFPNLGAQSSCRPLTPRKI